MGWPGGILGGSLLSGRGGLAGAATALCAAAVLSGACDLTLPQVAPERFACEDDVSLDNDRLPCGPEYWCVENACTPRLGCIEGDLLGCDPELRRCEPVVTDLVSAVRCEGGVHTETSTRPMAPDRCDCPDGLHCVAYLEGPDVAGDDYAPDLRFLPEGGAAPGQEVLERRLCVRACSEEDNCPGNHTCRPALVEGPALIETRGVERNTIAVCYPNVLAETSSTSTVTQPIQGVCQQAADCADMEVCRYAVDRVQDHPVAPIGASWDESFALVARCASRSGVQLREVGFVCTAGNECQTGICVGMRCRAPCDPLRPEEGCDRRNCREEEVLRRTMTGAVVVDRLFACER